MAALNTSLLPAAFWLEVCTAGFHVSMVSAELNCEDRPRKSERQFEPECFIHLQEQPLSQRHSLSGHGTTGHARIGSPPPAGILSDHVGQCSEMRMIPNAY